MATDRQMVPDTQGRNPLGYEPVGKLLLAFSVPSVISMLVNSVYNIVDQIFIGQGVGVLGNAATTIAFPVVTIMLAVSTMLGGGKVNLIGNIIEQEFTTSSNWNLGAGLSLVMMVFIVISMAFIEKFDRNGEGSVI